MSSAPLLSAVTPHPIESADLLRPPRRRRASRPTVGALARGLGVLALSACAVVALAKFQHAQHDEARPTAVAAKVEALPPPAKSATSDVRLVYGNPDAARAAAKAPEAAPPETIASAPRVETPPPVVREEVAAASPSPFVVPAPVVALEPSAPAAEAVPVAAPFAAAAPSTAATPAASSGVDLNAAPVELLNGLGAGMIGRAIVRGRPYASAQDLVERRILTRANFDKIRDRVVVGQQR